VQIFTRSNFSDILFSISVPNTYKGF